MEKALPLLLPPSSSAKCWLATAFFELTVVRARRRDFFSKLFFLSRSLSFSLALWLSLSLSFDSPMRQGCVTEERVWPRVRLGRKEEENKKVIVCLCLGKTIGIFGVSEEFPGYEYPWKFLDFLDFSFLGRSSVSQSDMAAEQTSCAPARRRARQLGIIPAAPIQGQEFRARFSPTHHNGDLCQLGLETIHRILIFRMIPWKVHFNASCLRDFDVKA